MVRKVKDVTEREMLEAHFDDGKFDLDDVFGSGAGRYKRLKERVEKRAAERAAKEKTDRGEKNE